MIDRPNRNLLQSTFSAAFFPFVTDHQHKLISTFRSNLSSKTVDSVQTDYTYDAIDQLLTEARSGHSVSYTYDANGNRLTKTLNSVTDTYICDEGDKLTSITRGGNTIRSFTYEKFGRMATSIENSVTTTYAYDFEARLTSVTRSGMTKNTAGYNGLGSRITKTDSAGSKTFKRDGAYVLDQVLSDGSATYTTSDWGLCNFQMLQKFLQTPNCNSINKLFPGCAPAFILTHFTLNFNMRL